MADSINPYRSALAPYFPNKTGQEYRQDPNKVTHYLVYLNQEAPLGQWLKPDPTKLKKDETVHDKINQRINALVTEKKLHPLHLCAMLNLENMAKKLLDTKVCQLDPQDACGFTPLHHAAVNNFQNMIALFLKYGANPKQTNSRDGTYLQVLNLVHPSIDPAAQRFYYKHPQSGAIGQCNGIDFQKLTGAQTFLDKEPAISTEEIVKEWNENPAPEGPNPPVIFTIVQKAYEQFKKSPPLIYVEKREGVGLNICAGEDITSGTMVTEYLGEIKPGKSFADADGTYRFDPFDAGKKRGIAALINDGFPNCTVIPLPNTGGVRQRLLIFATCKIAKEDSIVYDYGPGHIIKFDRRLELYDKEMTAFFQNCHSLREAYESSDKKVRGMTNKNARINTFDSTIKIAYLSTTPHAMLKLVCDQTHSIESIIQLLEQTERYYENYPLQKQIGTYFIYDVQQFSDALKTMEPEKANECRKTILESLSQMNLEDLTNLMKSLIKREPNQ